MRSKQAVSKDQPYLGLEAFSEEYTEYFYGRSEEIQELKRLIRKNNVLVLFGKSGIGKTSLLQAGLVPVLRKEYFLPVSIRINFINNSISPAKQVRQIVEQVIKKIDSTAINFEDLSFWEFFHRLKILNGFVTPILIFDQFEEIFSLGKSFDHQVRELITELADLIENQIPVKVQEKYKEEIPFPFEDMKVKVILSLREDYLPQLENLNYTIPSLRNGRFRIQQMNRNNAIEAVLKPGEKIIDEPEAAKIVDLIYARSIPDYAKQKDLHEIWDTYQIEPFILSLVCYQINGMRVLEYLNKITADLLNRVDIERIIKNFYIQNTYDLNHEAKSIFENGLLTHDGYRKLQHKNDLLVQKSSITEADINKLIDRRIIRTEIWNGSEHLELIHDVLVPIVKESRDKRIEEERKRKREEELKEIQKIEEKKRLAEKQQLEEDARIFREEQMKKIRNFRKITIIVLVAAIFSISFAIYAFQQNAVARKNEKRALANYVSANALIESSQNPTLGFDLAEQALRKDPESEMAQIALRNAFFMGSFYSILDSFELGSTTIDVAPKGTAILVCNGNNVSIHNSLGKEILSLKKHKGKVNSARFSPDGKFIVTASDDSLACLWNYSGKILSILAGHKKQVNMANFSSDGKYIITASSDGTAKLWNYDGTEISNFKEHTNIVTKAVFNSNKNKALTCGRDYKAILWNENGTPEKIMELDAPVLDAKFTPNGENIILTVGDSSIRIFDMEANQLISSKTTNCIINDINFSPDGKMILAAGNDKNIYILSSLDLKTIKILKGHNLGVSEVKFSSDQKIIYSISDDKTIRSWAFLGLQEGELRRFDQTVYSASYSEEGDKILSATQDMAVLWGLDGRNIQTFSGHKDQVFSAVFSPDYKYVLTSGSDSTARVYKMDGKNILILKHKSQVFKAIYTPNGKFILTACQDGNAYIWTIDGVKKTIIKSGQDLVYSTAISPDGKTIITAGADNTVKIWNFEGELKKTLKIHKDIVMDVAISPNGKYFASCSRDNTAIIWKLDGDFMCQLSGHEDIVNSVEFSPDSKNVITASRDRSARLWNLHGIEIFKYKNHKDDVFDAVFTADGKYILSVSSDQTVRQWPIEAQEILRLINEEKIYGNIWKIGASFINKYK